MTDKPLSLTLEHFEDGLVLGLHVPGIEKFPAYVEQVREWIKAGLLVCRGEPNPDPVHDQLWRATPKTERPVVNSWNYQNGDAQRKTDHTTGLTTECKATGVSRLQWLAGYSGEAEKPEHDYRTQWANDQAEAVAENTRARRLATDQHGLNTDQTWPSSSEVASVDRSSTELMGLEEDGGELFTFEDDELGDLFTGDLFTISSIHDLRNCCLGTAAEDIWRALAIHAANELKPHGWILPNETWDEAIESLLSLERASQPNAERFIASINSVFQDWFKKGDDMVTAAVKKSAKAKANSKKPAAKPEAKKATGAKAKVDAAMFRIEDQIQEWDISTITKSPYDERIEEPENAPELLKLTALIKQYGQLNPLLIRPTGEHIAGWRRVRALKKLGIKKAFVRVIHCDDLTAGNLVLQENEERKDLTEREKCLAYNSRLKSYIEAGKNQKQLAADLTLDHSTLSNKLRLKSLSHDAWVFFEEGWLTIDQLRALATHAMVPKFEDAFLGYAETQKAGGSKPLADFAVKNAMASGFQAAYRRLDTLGAKVTEAQRKELGVTTIEDPQLGKIEVTTNVEKFEALKTAAADRAAKKEEKQEEQQAAKPKPPKVKAPEKAAKERDVAEVNAEIVVSWCMAFATAIRDRFVKPKAKDTPLLMRLGMLVQQSARETDQLSLEELLTEDKEFIELMQRAVLDFFDTTRPASAFEVNWSELRLVELERIAKWLAVNATPFYVPTQMLIEKLTDEEAIALRDECELEPGVTDTDRKELNQRILAVWEPPCSWFPERFNYKSLPAAVPF